MKNTGITRDYNFIDIATKINYMIRKVVISLICLLSIVSFSQTKFSLGQLLNDKKLHGMEDHNLQYKNDTNKICKNVNYYNKQVVNFQKQMGYNELQIVNSASATKETISNSLMRFEYWGCLDLKQTIIPAFKNWFNFTVGGYDCGFSIPTEDPYSFGNRIAKLSRFTLYINQQRLGDILIQILAKNYTTKQLILWEQKVSDIFDTDLKSKISEFTTECYLPSPSDSPIGPIEPINTIVSVIIILVVLFGIILFIVVFSKSFFRRRLSYEQI